MHKKTVILPLADLKRQISERTILANFPSVDTYRLRPPAEFDPATDKRKKNTTTTV
jgi:hypothetical protein